MRQEYLRELTHCLLAWQAYMKASSTQHRGLNPDLALVGFHHAAGDGQPETGPRRTGVDLLGAGAGGLTPIEAIENTLAFSLFNTRSAVIHEQLDRPVGRERAQLDLPARGRVP